MKCNSRRGIICRHLKKKADFKQIINVLRFYYYCSHPAIAKKEKENAITNTGLPNLKHTQVQNGSSQYVSPKLLRNLWSSSEVDFQLLH